MALQSRDPLFFNERTIKHHSDEIERLLYFLMKNVASCMLESKNTKFHTFEGKKYFVRVRGRCSFHIDDKIGHAHGAFAASLTTLRISYSYNNNNNNTLMINLSLDQNFPIRLSKSYRGVISLKLLITTIGTLPVEDKGEAIKDHFVIPPEAESSPKQLQYQNSLACVGDPEVSKFSDVSAFKPCKVSSLKGLHHLHHFSYSDIREDKIPKQAGVGMFRDLTKNDFNFSAVHASTNEKGRSRLNTNAALKVKKEYVLLPAATLIATVMFTAACGFPRFITKANYSYNYDTGRIIHDKRDSTIASSFILFNSTGFIVSLAIVISILRSFPLKPWPQISVSMFFGSYMCLIMKILPWESWIVLFLSVPLLLLAAAGKLCNFAE